MGKPRISGPAPDSLYFNVSYGADSLAVTTEIPWRELCESEKAQLRTLPVKKRYERFVCMWTLKEAFAKCLGVGCSLEFDQLETWLWPAQVKSRPTDQARRRCSRSTISGSISPATPTCSRWQPPALFGNRC